MQRPWHARVGSGWVVAGAVCAILGASAVCFAHAVGGSWWPRGQGLLGIAKSIHLLVAVALLPVGLLTMFAGAARTDWGRPVLRGVSWAGIACALALGVLTAAGLIGACAGRRIVAEEMWIVSEALLVLTVAAVAAFVLWRLARGLRKIRS